MAESTPRFKKRCRQALLKASIACLLCSAAHLGKCSFAGLSLQHPAASIRYCSRAAIDCGRPNCDEVTDQEQALSWAATRKCQQKWKALCPCCVDTTTLETLQPKLEEFAQHLANGYGEMGMLGNAVRERREREAEEAVAAISSGVLHKARQAANDILGDGVWDAAVDAIASYCGGDHIHAHLVLAKAYGWKAWVEMNQPVYIKPKPPHPVAQIRHSLKWLREGPLGMTEDELKSALLVKPLPYLTNPAKKYKGAISCAPEQWRAREVFRELLRREPKVLQLTWNCQYTDPFERDRVLGVLATGESFHCDGKCTKCWRSVTPSLMGMALDGIGV